MDRSRDLSTITQQYRTQVQEGCSGIQFLKQHYATPPLQSIVYGLHTFKLIPWLFFFILNHSYAQSYNSKKSSILLLEKPSFPQSSLNPWRKNNNNNKPLSLISNLKQDMRINTASHSHSELLLKMGMDLEKYSGSALFCACFKPLQRMLWFFVLFCFVLFCFKEC